MLVDKAKGLIRHCVCMCCKKGNQVKHCTLWQTCDCRLSTGTARRQDRTPFAVNIIVKILYTNYSSLNSAKFTRSRDFSSRMWKRSHGKSTLPMTMIEKKKDDLMAACMRESPCVLWESKVVISLAMNKNYKFNASRIGFLFHLPPRCFRNSSRRLSIKKQHKSFEICYFLHLIFCRRLALFFLLSFRALHFSMGHKTHSCFIRMLVFYMLTTSILN